MHQDKRWKSVEIRIEKNYLFFENSKYSFELEKLWAADQKYRTLTRHINDLGYVPILKDLSLEKLDFPANLEDLDRNNIQKLKALLHEYSFPKTSEVSKRSAKTAAVILIHSEDSILIKQYLPIMEKYCKEGEADWGYFAMLYDKYCTIRKEPQRYGTQYLSNPKNPTEMLLAKLENPLLINERRKKIGLLPLSLDVIEKALKN